MSPPTGHPWAEAPLLPAPARRFHLYLDRPYPELGHIVLPPSLVSAIAKRQMQFRAGRYCAMKAMEALDERFIGLQLGRSPAGEPLWPAGLVGSITHTDDYASAAVAWTTDALGVGIDTELIMSEHKARAVGRIVAWPADLAPARAAGMNRLEALTLVFSAKEAVFKCLHQRVGRMFEFHDVRLCTVDASERTFTVRLARTLSEEFPAGTILDGRFVIEDRWIHTGVYLPNQHRSAGSIA